MGEKRSSLHGSQEAMKKRGDGNGDTANDLIPPTRPRFLMFPPLPISPLSYESINRLIDP
jgi:hypothetical protein